MIRPPALPIRWVLIPALLSAALAAGAVRLVLDEPTIELHLRVTDDGNGVVTTDRWVTQQPLDWQAVAWRDGSGQSHPIDATLLVEEPDQLPSYAAWDRVLTRSGELHEALLSGHLTLLDASGQAHGFPTRARQLGELPWMLWVQILTSWLVLLISLAVWRRADARQTALHFVFSTTAYFVATGTSTVYAARELALNETVFRTLSHINHLAGVMMPATVAVLLWLYPTPLIRRRGILGIYAVTLVTVALAQGQWPDAMPLVIYGPQALLLVGIIAGCIRQWQRGRTDAVKRSILSVYLLALVASTPVCGALVLVPQLSGHGSMVSQAIMLLSFLPGYIGLAIGIARFRLFDLDRWWFIAWAWILGSLLLLAFYAALTYVFSLDRVLSLSIALGLIGWIYFPARQWLWQRFARREGLIPEQVLPEALALFFSQRDLTRFDEVWEHFLLVRLKALESRRRREPVESVMLEEDGHVLAVPSVVGEDSFTLHYPDAGRRLFNRDDRRWVSLLWELACCHVKSGRSHLRDLHAMRRGVQRDLQDDLVGRLAVLVRSDDPRTVELARAAMRSVHDAVEALDDETRMPLGLALRTLDESAQRRCRMAGTRLVWHDDSSAGDRLLGPRLRITIDRILGALIGHRLKHAGAHLIEVSTHLDANVLRIDLRDANGTGGEPIRSTDAAFQVLEQRIMDLGGHLVWIPDGRVTVQIPLDDD